VERLHGRVALITGAGSGIGRATALRLAREGALVAGLDRDADGLRETSRLVEEQHGRMHTHQADLTDGRQVETAVTAVVERAGRLDIVFNGAGASGRRHGDGPVDACSEQGWDWTLNTNLRSAFLVCKYSVPHLLATGAGAIVNLASVLGMVGGDEDFATHAYAAAKAGMIGMSRAMARYYAPRGLRVNVVAPGLIATPMSQRAQTDAHIQQRLRELQPLTGAMGTPEDLAAAVAYLASDDARFLTGIVLPVDGGWTAQ
jgi:NAD(P)-dependent dehydrogenase (short-subunit alcohol dehydrogenase family)